MFEQEVQCSIDSGWCAVKSITPEFFENGVGTNRLVAFPNQFQHPLALFGKAAITLTTNA